MSLPKETNTKAVAVCLSLDLLGYASSNLKDNNLASLHLLSRKNSVLPIKWDQIS